MPSEALSDGIYFEVLVVFASDILMVEAVFYIPGNAGRTAGAYIWKSSRPGWFPGPDVWKEAGQYRGIFHNVYLRVFLVEPFDLQALAQ
ncbi:hypothetical protein F9Z36_1758 [Neisseria gonorrhoeae]|nr:hypothetical protein F9Z36_1758 [Neisseria gonorrhoeae]